MGSGSSKLYRREDLHYAPTVYPAAVESALSDTDIAQHQKLLDHAGPWPASACARLPAIRLIRRAAQTRRWRRASRR